MATPHPILLTSPYPLLISDETLQDGHEIAQPLYCRNKCTNRECLTYAFPNRDIVPEFHTCSHGFSVAVAKVRELRIRVNGVIDAFTNKGSARFRKEHRSQKIKQVRLACWLERLYVSLPIFGKYVELQARDSIQALHDIKSLISSILRTSEKWVWNHAGDTLDEKVNNSPESLQTIHKSCQLLATLLQMTDIIANPDAARFGKPRPITVSNAIYLIIKLHEAKARKRKNEIQLIGRSQNRVCLYNSFIVVPLTLLDNAIKHSASNSNIQVTLKDLPDGRIDVKISSVGYLIPEVDRMAVFERGVRGSNSKVPGTGLGLFIAQVVAKANGFSIGYEGRPSKGRDDYGFNCFKFTLPTSAPTVTGSGFEY